MTRITDNKVITEKRLITDKEVIANLQECCLITKCKADVGVEYIFLFLIILHHTRNIISRSSSFE